MIDPLGGSYYIESLTDSMERQAETLFEDIARAGGVVRALESGWLQRKIAQSSARQQWEFEQHRKLVVRYRRAPARTQDVGQQRPPSPLGEQRESAWRCSLSFETRQCCINSPT